jgi:hypothetical protein
MNVAFAIPFSSSVRLSEDVAALEDGAGSDESAAIGPDFGTLASCSSNSAPLDANHRAGIYPSDPSKRLLRSMGVDEELVRIVEEGMDGDSEEKVAEEESDEEKFAEEESDEEKFAEEESDEEIVVEASDGAEDKIVEKIAAAEDNMAAAEDVLKKLEHAKVAQKILRALKTMLKVKVG